MSSPLCHPLDLAHIIYQWINPSSDYYTLGYLTPRYLNNNQEPKPLCQTYQEPSCPSMCRYPLQKAPRLKQGCCIEKYLT